MVNSENIESTINKLSELKTKQGFQNNTWDEWIKSVLAPNTVSVKDTIEMFGNTKVGRSKAMRMIAVESLWRRPIKQVSNVSDEQMLHYI